MCLEGCFLFQGVHCLVGHFDDGDGADDDDDDDDDDSITSELSLQLSEDSGNTTNAKCVNFASKMQPKSRGFQNGMWRLISLKSYHNRNSGKRS